MGRPIQVVDGDILPCVVGSVDALARERLGVDVASGTGFLFFPHLDVQSINLMFKILLLGAEGTLEPGSNGSGRSIAGGGGEAAGGQGETVRGNCQSQGPLPTFKDGVAVGMEDGDCCLVKNNLAALVGKRPQTNEAMGGTRA